MTSIISNSLMLAIEARAAMQARARMAAGEFYAKAGIDQPVVEARFQIVQKAKAFHIHDRTTGRVVGFCFTYRAAEIYAEALERGASQRLVPRRLNS